MEYPDNQGSCGGKEVDCEIPFKNASSIGFSVPIISGLARRITSMNNPKNRNNDSEKITNCLFFLNHSIIPFLFFLKTEKEKTKMAVRIASAPLRVLLITPALFPSQKA